MGASSQWRGRHGTKELTERAAPAAEHLQHPIDGDKPHRYECKRSGKTYRRVSPGEARSLRRASLLQFSVSPARRSDNVCNADDADAGLERNANLNCRGAIQLWGSHFASHVPYSLNKHGRWHFAKQLTQEYNSCEELREQNLFLVETVAGGTKQGAARKLTTNVCYIMDAAEELHHHKKRLSCRRSCSQAKEQQERENRFQFSERVSRGQAERPLTSFSAASTAGSINAKSIRRCCSSLAQQRSSTSGGLRDLPPSAEAARLALQTDCEARPEVFVGTSAAATTNGNKARWLGRQQRHRMPVYRSGGKQIQHLARESRRSELEMQLLGTNAAGRAMQLCGSAESHVDRLLFAYTTKSSSRLLQQQLLRCCPPRGRPFRRRRVPAVRFDFARRARQFEALRFWDAV